jgi:hypothetical protein
MTDVTGTGSVTTAGGSGANYNDNSEGKTTPKKFNVDEDCRGMEGGGQYPNYWSHKTRSGHCFIMDDSKGNESVTIQHRSGTAIQMRPDGGMLLTTHNGKYEVVLGEERVTISGASDITVKGDTSLRCYGDYNVTVHKDYNLTVLGNMNMTCKNLNRQVRGTMDTETKTDNKRVEGTKTTNVLGALSQTSTGDMSMASTKGKTQVAGYSAAGFYTTGQNSPMVVANLGNGKNYVSGAGDWHYTQGSSGAVGIKYGSTGGAGTEYQLRRVIDSKGEHKEVADDIRHTVKLGNYNFSIQEGNHTTQVTGQKSVKAGSSNETVTSGNKVVTVQQGSSSHVVTTGSMEMRAPSGSASFVGGSTNISSLSGLLGMAGTAGVALDSLGSLLNLNGGIAQIASALGISLPFDISSPTQADTVPQLQGTQANQPTQEPDATGEIDSWQ